MSAHDRKQWESEGLRSSEALSMLNGLRRERSGYASPSWLHGVEARAIAEFVAYQSAHYRQHSSNAVHEDLVVACARFGVDPKWFFTDENGTVDETGTRGLRADVAHYRIMHGLDDE